MLEPKQDAWEKTLASKVEAYLREMFGASPDLQRAHLPQLPYFIPDQYAIWSADLVGRACLLMAPKPGSDASVEEMGRHADLVRDRSDGRLVVLLFEAVTPARRHALLVRRMAFMAPRAQIFIPEALMDLRERTPRHPPRDVETFSPTAQLAILGAILRPDTQVASATHLARRYGVAIMSMTRAFDELEMAGLADAGRVGQHRSLRLHHAGRALWDAASPRLQSPVRKVRAVIIPRPERFPGKVAGESALGHYTPLARPRRQWLAVASSDWNQLVRDHGLRETDANDPDGAFVETWAYDPGALTHDNVVDRLSLHLSVRDHLDERVAIAAEDLLEGVKWS